MKDRDRKQLVEIITYLKSPSELPLWLQSGKARLLADHIARLESVARHAEWFLEHRGVSSERQLMDALQAAGYGDVD